MLHFEEPGLMFDVQSFFNTYNILYREGEGRNGLELKVDCPICGGKQKLWCSTHKEVLYCHRCAWSPKGASQLISAFLRANPFQLDLIERKFQKKDENVSIDNVYESLTDNSSLDVSLVQFENDGHYFQSFFKDMEREEGPLEPLEWPPYCVPLGDPRIVDITMYAFSRRFSFKLLKKHYFGGCAVGKYSGSLVIPAINGGELKFWQARDTTGKDYSEYPKYRTPYGYSSKGCLFNLDIAVGYDEVVICEGVFSALRVGEDAVATFGNKISEQQVRLLVDRGVRKVVLCFDPDTWSIPKAMIDRGVTNIKPPIFSAVSALLHNFEQIRVVRLKNGDPDEIGSQKVRELIENAIVVESKFDLVTIT